MDDQEAARQRWLDAKEHCGPDQMIVGYYRKEAPHYVLVPRDSEDGDIEQACFRDQHGRPMSEPEQQLWALAKRSVL